MKHIILKKIVSLAALAGVIGAATSARAVVYAGGVWSGPPSAPVKGMSDLAIAGNSDSYRSYGGRLYCHELGWTDSTSADKTAIRSLFSQAPVYEGGYGSGPTHPAAAIRAYLLPYWSQGCWTDTIDKIGDLSNADMDTLMASMPGLASRVAPISSPNSGQWMTNAWSSTRWNQLRINAVKGFAFCTDAPPYYYLHQPAGYQAWINSALIWANGQANVSSQEIYSPNVSTDFYTDVKLMTAALDNAGARPAVVNIENYYGSTPGPTAHFIGSEDDTTKQSIMYSAHWLAEVGR